MKKKTCVLSIGTIITLGLLQIAETKANTSLRSDTTKLQMIVIDENRLQVRFDQQNRHIQILSSAQLEKIPGRTLNEILGQIPGIDLRQRGAFGSQADISIDGGTFEQTLVLINGVKVIDMQTAHNVLNLPFPLDAIERIEVLRGPAARIFGVNSLTGALNIVTKKPLESGLSAHVYGGSGFKKMALSTEESAEEELLWGKGIQLGLQTAHQDFQNAVYGSFESGNGYRYNTAFKNQKVWMDGQKKLNEKHQVGWMGGYVNSDFGANGFYAAPGDIESQEVVQTAMGTLHYKNQINPKFSWSPRISYRYSYDDYRYFRHDLTRARSQHYSHAVTGEIHSQYQIGWGELGFGVEARQEKINSSNIQNHERENYGTYAEFRTERIPRLNLSAGAYMNYNSDYGWQVFPGIDVGYAFLPNWRFVAHSGTGQRIPSFTDLYLNQRPGNIGNPELLSEVAWNTEGGLKFNRENGYFQAIYFYRHIRDFIDWVRETTDVPWQPHNFQNNETHGFSISGQFRLKQHPDSPSQWLIGGGYTFLNPSIQDAQHKSLRSKYGLQTLRHQLQFQGAYEYNGLKLGSTLRFQERLNHQDYWVWDVRVSHPLAKGASVYVDLQNILDVTYIEAEAVPMPGRWLHVGFKYQMNW